VHQHREFRNLDSGILAAFHSILLQLSGTDSAAAPFIIRREKPSDTEHQSQKFAAACNTGNIHGAQRWRGWSIRTHGLQKDLRRSSRKSWVRINHARNLLCSPCVCIHELYRHKSSHLYSADPAPVHPTERIYYGRTIKERR
jgi:hypothetical protein